MKILVATPVYDGAVMAQQVNCLTTETHLARELGDEIRLSYLPSCSVPAAGRNQIVDDFLKSDCDRLFFLDSDVTFNPGDLIKTCYRPVELVGGCYPFKNKVESYPILWDPEIKYLRLDANGLLEVAGLPAGFLCLSRSVFEKFREAYPDREYDHQGHKFYAYFQYAFSKNGLYSEDNYFCHEWRSIGGKVYLDPELTLTHWDIRPTPYVGHIGNWLKNRSVKEGGLNASL